MASSHPLCRCWLLAFFSLALPAWLGALPPSGKDSRPWTRWWWLGSAVDEKNLTRELEQLAAAGFGGVEITPIYGVKGNEGNEIPFLSPRYLEVLTHVGREAKRLGLKVDMATGTGWPFGGPSVGQDEAELKVERVPESPRLRIVASNFRVKRAAPGGEGLVLDPYSVSALRRYLRRFDTALAEIPRGLLHGQFHDSFEYTANWSRELPERFLALHGYDLRSAWGIDSTAAVASMDTEQEARIKADYRATLETMHLDYLQHWVAWAHQHGQVARNQAHGSPGNWLDFYAVSDVPETELFGGTPLPIPGFRFEAREVGKDRPVALLHRFAASAAHVAGKPLVSAEAFTWLREHFHESPAQMKAEADRLFASGVNRLVYHGTAYSPDTAAWPGWLFYASSQINSRNPLWAVIPELNRYFSACQFWLQFGEPDADLLVYWPIEYLRHDPEGFAQPLTVHQLDWLSRSTLNDTVGKLDAAGLSWDLVSDRLLERCEAKEGAIQAPGGRYRGVVIPRTRLMPASTLAQLERLVLAGVPVVFLDALPDDVPGWGRLAERRAAFRTVATALQSRLVQGSPAHRLRVLPVSEATPEGLRALWAPWGAVTGETGDWLSLRRRSGSDQVIFLVNQTETVSERWVSLGQTQTVDLFDPMTGRRGSAEIRRSADRQSARVILQPGQSVFLLTGSLANSPQRWSYAPSRTSHPLTTEPWSLEFLQGGPQLPPTQVLAQPRAWTEDPSAQAFSGTAVYRSSFDCPADQAARRVLLHLGDVREAARVSVNGIQCGWTWSLPHEVELTGALRPGRNLIEIEVTNLGANRIRDLDARGIPWRVFRDINFVDIHYTRFDASLWPVAPSGLLGPLRVEYFDDGPKP